MYKVLKNESDFDDWIRVLPDEARGIVLSSGRIKSILCFCVCETKNSEIPCAPS